MDDTAETRPFKKLTVANWREHDPTVDHMVRISEGRAHKISEDEWATQLLEAELSGQVLKDVRYLFEVAQGALCFGCFFYPLYALGCEQLCRVLEAALHHRCAQLEAPKNVNSFGRMLEWLRNHAALDEQQSGYWEPGRNLRNIASNARRHSIFSPDMAVEHLWTTAELINELFREHESASPSKQAD